VNSWLGQLVTRMTTEARDQYHASSCEIVVNKVTFRQVSLPVLEFHSVSFHQCSMLILIYTKAWRTSDKDGILGTEVLQKGSVLTCFSRFIGLNITQNQWILN